MDILNSITAFLILCVLASIAEELKKLRKMLALRENHLDNAMRKWLEE